MLHVDVVALNVDRVQLMSPLVEPSSSRFTFPLGGIAGAMDVSLTYVVQESLAFTATIVDAQLRIVDVVRRLMVIFATFLLEA